MKSVIIFTYYFLLSLSNTIGQTINTAIPKKIDSSQKYLFYLHGGIVQEYGVNAIITEKTQDYKQSDEKWWNKAKIEGAYIMSGTGSEDYGGAHFWGELVLAVHDGE